MSFKERCASLAALAAFVSGMNLSYAEVSRRVEYTYFGPNGKHFKNRETLGTSLGSGAKLVRVTFYNKYAEADARATLNITQSGYARALDTQYVQKGSASYEASNTWYVNQTAESFGISIAEDPCITKLEWEYEIDLPVVTRTEIKEVTVEVEKSLYAPLVKRFTETLKELDRYFVPDDRSALGRAFISTFVTLDKLRAGSKASGDRAFFNEKIIIDLLNSIDSIQTRDAIDAYYRPGRYSDAQILAIQNLRDEVAEMREITKYFEVLNFSVLTPGFKPVSSVAGANAGTNGETNKVNNIQ